ncbi:hypothetical protein [Aquisphaera insulae]|uniref:hypothetical protein n=1 Tax=Aquisphaera insulae TaxID=2712864 RepID=UPI0013EC954E|nr:hypothetical protein [Aquisphaera insulae]
MYGIRRSVLLLCLGATSVQAMDIAVRGAEEPAQGPPGYASPREAFEARRKALAGRDWRTAFASSTPAVQDLEVEYLVRCWILNECGFDDYKFEEPQRSANKARLSAAMKKHGLELTNFSFGLVFNQEKFIKTMASRVADRAAFYAEASELIRPVGKESPESIHDFGDLQGVVESGDSASGWIVWTFKNSTRSARLLRKFRKVDGRWLNDSETWDYTRRISHEPAQGPPGYASPREAFEARRKALAGRDWRTAFASSTPAVQGQEVENLVSFWVVFETGGGIGGPFVGNEPDFAAQEAIEARFRETMKKHGLVFPLFGFGLEERIKAMTPRDADKMASFYEEVSEIMWGGRQEASDSVDGFGDLQGIEVSGDTARGWVAGNRDQVHQDGAKKAAKPVRRLWKFRRLNGRWFNDGMTSDPADHGSEKGKP